MIIGICGFIGSGKDTVADYLVNFHEFRRESFASTLKDAVSAVFGWDRTMLEGRTKEAREWREQIDPWWAERLDMPALTPRWVLQYWGTEVCRKGFHDDIWIASLENKLRNSKDHVVISDCRFPNEIASIRNAGGKIIWIKRGELPAWYDLALQHNQGSEEANIQLAKLKVHASETAWVGTDFDHVLENNSTIDDLYKQIKNLVQDPLDANERPLYVGLSDSLRILS
jgi:hypothetical protein